MAEDVFVLGDVAGSSAEAEEVWLGSGIVKVFEKCLVVCLWLCLTKNVVHRRFLLNQSHGIG